MTEIKLNDVRIKYNMKFEPGHTTTWKRIIDPFGTYQCLYIDDSLTPCGIVSEITKDAVYTGMWYWEAYVPSAPTLFRRVNPHGYTRSEKSAKDIVELVIKEKVL
jgi:hypothetical protein